MRWVKVSVISVSVANMPILDRFPEDVQGSWRGRDRGVEVAKCGRSNKMRWLAMFFVSFPDGRNRWPRSLARHLAATENGGWCPVPEENCSGPGEGNQTSGSQNRSPAISIL